MFKRKEIFAKTISNLDDDGVYHGRPSAVRNHSSKIRCVAWPKTGIYSDYKIVPLVIICLLQAHLLVHHHHTQPIRDDSPVAMKTPSNSPHRNTSLEKSLAVLQNLVDDHGAGKLEAFKTKHPEAPIYFDFGLSDGKDTKFYLSQGYSTVSVDAYAPWIDKAKNDFKDEINDGRSLLFNIGISTKDEDSMKLYFKNEGSVIASLEPSKGCQHINPNSPACKHIDIPVVRCESVFALIGRAATFAKVDIEMLHHSCIRGLKNLPTSLLPQKVCWEEHDKPFGPAKILRPITDVELILGMSELGYDKVKVVLQGDKAGKFYGISYEQSGGGQQSGNLDPDDMMHYRSFEKESNDGKFDVDWRSVQHVIEEGMFTKLRDKSAHFFRSGYFDVCMKLGSDAENQREIMSHPENFPLSSYSD